jgi:hypothetical protein
MATPQELITLIQERILQKWKAAHPDTDISANDIEWWKYIQIPRDIKDSPTGKLGGPNWLQALFNDKVVTDRFDPSFERLVSRMASSVESDEALTNMFADAIEEFPNIPKYDIKKWNEQIATYLLGTEGPPPRLPKLKDDQSWWDLVEPLVTGGIIEAEAAEKWNTFKSKYVPIVNGKIKLPSDFSPTNGEDRELDKIIIEDIQSNAAGIQEQLKSLYLQKLRGNPQATDEEMFRILLEGGPSGLSAADIAALDPATLLNSLPELLMRGTLDEYRTQSGISATDTARFPEGAPPGIVGDTYTDSAGNVRNNNSYRPGTADIPHVVTNRNGKETYYDENWQEVSPPREDVGPVEFKPDSRYFERDPVTGEWKLNEAVSNLPLGQQAQFDNRFKLAEEAMSNIQKGGQLGINYAAQDLKGREYLDDMLRDPGMSLARMANFRGDPQWKGGRFGGVSPADRFNDYQNYYGGLNEQLRNLFANQGLFNAASAAAGPAFPGSTPPPAGGPGPGATGPGGTDPNTKFVPLPVDPDLGSANAAKKQFVPIPANPLPGGTNSLVRPPQSQIFTVPPQPPISPGTIPPPGGGPSAGLPSGPSFPGTVPPPGTTPSFPGSTPPPAGGSPIPPPPVVPPGGPGNLPPPPNIITPPPVGKGPPIFKGPGNSPPPPMNVPPAIDIGSDKGVFNPPGSVKTSGNRFATGNALNNFMAQLAKEKENNRKLRLRPPVTSRRGSFG